MTTPAAETKSIGLLADAQLSAFFALPFIKYTLTRNLLLVNRDSYVRQFYRDVTTPYHLPGLAKNSPAPTQTATQTTGPLSFIYR